MECKNCAYNVEGKFCPNCGQSSKVDTINLSYLLGEISESVFQINRGFFYTLKELIIRPGHSIREYLSGKRKNHFKPIAYALTVSTIYFLLSQFLDSQTFVGNFVEGLADGWDSYGESEGDDVKFNKLNWLVKNHAITILMLLPLFSFASYLAFFKTGYSYLEHFVLNSYITGQQALLYALASVLSLAIENTELLATASLYISIAYAIFVLWQFFNKQSRISVLVRSILTYLLSGILLFLFLLLFFIITWFKLQ